MQVDPLLFLVKFMVKLKGVNRLKMLSLQIGERLSSGDDFTIERVSDGWVYLAINPREVRSGFISYASILNEIQKLKNNGLF